MRGTERGQDGRMSGIELQCPWGLCLHTTGRVWNMGIFSFNTQNALLQDALKNPALKKPSDLQKLVQSGSVEADPDVGLLTMASFPPLVESQQWMTPTWLRESDMSWSVTLAPSPELSWTSRRAVVTLAPGCRVRSFISR